MSTLKVDTYLTRGGASEIAIDKLKGVTAAGSMLVVGEGGTNTTNLQQGLCKFFSNIVGTGTISTRDSFNQSGITDNGTGDYDFAFTNDMGNDDYTTMVGCDSASNHMARQYSEAEQNAGGCRVSVLELSTGSADATVTDSGVVMMDIHGDLA
jgi:hypothetical protein